MKSQAVLAIDDSMDIHQQLRARLRSEGVELHHAHSAEEGLALARRLLPDLILLDVDMPNMTGLEVCRALKSDATTVSIPVIFLSGASAVHDKVHGRVGGARQSARVRRGRGRLRDEAVRGGGAAGARPRGAAHEAVP